MQSGTETIGGVERIMISLPLELLKKLNAIAKRKGLARTAYIRMVLTLEVEKEERES